MLQWSDSEGEYVRGLLGTPYGAGVGQLNCIGVFVRFWRDHGLNIPDPAHSESLGCSLSALVDESAFDPICHHATLLPAATAPQYGDGVFMAVGIGQNEPDTHVGVWTPIGILHASRAGVVLIPDRRARACRFFRPNEAANACQVR